MNSGFCNSFSYFFFDTDEFVEIITCNFNRNGFSSWWARIFSLNRNFTSWNSLQIFSHFFQKFDRRNISTLFFFYKCYCYFRFLRRCRAIGIERVSCIFTNIRYYRIDSFFCLISINYSENLIFKHFCYRVCYSCISSYWHYIIYINKVRVATWEENNLWFHDTQQHNCCNQHPKHS